MKYSVKKLCARMAIVLIASGTLYTEQLSQAQPPLSGDEIARQMLARAETASPTNHDHDYQYRKHTVTEESDGKGRLKDRKEKLYQVAVESGVSYLKLLQLNGEKLSPSEIKKQSERDAAERAKITDSSPTKKGDNRENFLTPELLAKFKLNCVAVETIGGRANYVVTFAPTGEAMPVKKMTDRFLNNVSGKAWIDVADFEITKAEVHLRSEITLWGGLLGTLRRCDYSLQRTRQPDGVWINTFSHGVFEGRKLLETVTIKTMSESSDFQKLALATGQRTPASID